MNRETFRVRLWVLPWISVVLLLPQVSGLLWASEPLTRSNGQRPIEFERDVRPILKAYCWHCHGEEPELSGKLDARLVRTLRQGGESGPSVIEGNANESLLIKKITEGEMPPGEKKLTSAQLATLREWVDTGLKHARPEPERLAVGDILTDEDRGHWSFRPVDRPEVPGVTAEEGASVPVDAFLLLKLKENHLEFAPEADRSTLLRRLTLDLTGVPPTVEELDQCLQDAREDWYERVVDRLLSSPALGERWGRHWLDVAGYADSNGYTDKDTVRAWVWKYRDYVVRSVNEDREWDQFIIEQLAGDELVQPPFANLSQLDADRLIATAFLRLVPDGTGEGGADADLAKNDTIAESIKVISSSMLGLTVGCAQCHAHRFDPISHADYYRLRAVFAPALNWQDWKRPQDRLVSMWNDEVKSQAAKVEQEITELKKQRDSELDELVASTFEKELEKLPEDQREKARLARSTAAKDRSDEQKSLIKEYPFLNVDRGSVYLYLPDRQKGFNKKWDEQIKAVEARRPAEDFVFAVTESATTPPLTYVFARGDFKQPRESVEPTEIDVLRNENTPAKFGRTGEEEESSGARTSGRRLAFAKYLTSGRHPLFARVQVNRFWMHLFGRGIVATPGDFGLQGQRPTHPELFDWLASEFAESGWAFKPFLRELVLSSAYRQNSHLRPELVERDPDNRLLGRMPLRRLESEVVRDSILSTSGQLSSKRFGPPAPVTPDEVGQYIIGIDNRDTAGRPQGKRADIGEEGFRKTIYVQVRRSMPLSMIEPFDNPIMSPNCELRPTSTVATQALTLMNSEFTAQAADQLAKAVCQKVGSDPFLRMRWAVRQILSRDPSESELDAGMKVIEGVEPGSEEEHQRWVAFCHALLSSTYYVMVE